MDKLLGLSAFIVALGILIITFPDGNAAIVVTALASLLVIFLIRHFRWDERILLTRLFALSLFARLAFATFTHIFEYRDKLSGDSNTYHLAGRKLMLTWFGKYDGSDDIFLEQFTTSIGWGMSYFVASLYSITGADILSAQFLCAVIGAATVPLVYLCAKRIFNNNRVGLISALLIGFYPAFIIWSSQLLKDGLIVFCLVLAMTMILNLKEKFDYLSAAVLIGALVGISSLRFYIFYMIAAAMVGAFLIDTGKSQNALIRNLVILIVLGLGLTYFGAIRNATTEFDQYANLEQLQRSRSYAATTDSGFGQDVDVSTAEGAISAIPIGFAYVMFAPFPWQLTESNYYIAAPDVIIWWLSIPFLISGLIFAIKHNLRQSIGPLIFSLMLTLAYSLFQGNIGTAYRHRIQIQVFLFIFIAAGWVLYRERKENRQAMQEAENRKFREWNKKRFEKEAAH